MKRTKFLLPLLAFVFAIASAFASKDAGQMAWFHVAPNSNAEGEINNTDKVCATGRSFQCTIGGLAAYSSPTAANVENSAALLKYNN